MPAFPSNLLTYASWSKVETRRRTLSEDKAKRKSCSRFGRFPSETVYGKRKWEAKRREERREEKRRPGPGPGPVRRGFSVGLGVGVGERRGESMAAVIRTRRHGVPRVAAHASWRLIARPRGGACPASVHPQKARSGRPRYRGVARPRAPGAGSSDRPDAAPPLSAFRLREGAMLTRTRDRVRRNRTTIVAGRP